MTSTGPRRRSLLEQRPDLAAEWHPVRNGDLRPGAVTPGSGRLVWWLDELGHEWQSTVNNRSHGTGCPYCANQKVLAGFNDLASRHPAIAVEWHPARNGATTAEEVAPKTSRKIWWRCAAGHDFDMSVSNRTALGQGCPVCAGQQVLAGFNDMASTSPTLAAEWHPTRNLPLSPREVFRSTARRFWWIDAVGHEWEASANERSNGSGCPYCSGQRILVGFNDLATRRPELASQWHPTRNGPRTAEMVTVMNGTKAWWQDPFGHEWEAVISSRSVGTGCPVCAGQTVVAGVNDLASQRPEVAATWHPSRNATDLSVMAVYSNRHVWWMCAKGHEWRSTVNNRSHGQGCPECAERGFKPGQPGYVYFLEHHELGAFKIGITNVGTTRLASFQANGWHIVNLELFKHGHDAAAVERAIKAWWRHELGLAAWLGPAEMPATGGWSETISSQELTALDCIERIRSERSTVEELRGLSTGAVPDPGGGR